MDPQAVLDQAEDAIKNGDWQEARMLLEEFIRWRDRGGHTSSDLMRKYRQLETQAQRRWQVSPGGK